MQSAIALQYRRIQGQLLHMAEQQRALAAELDMRSDDVDEALLHRWLEAPLHVLVCGETRVGKSRLLQRLFDCSLPATEVGSKRQQLLAYQHLSTSTSVEEREGVCEIALADEALRGWRLTEAADAHCREPAYLEALHCEWHACDVAFFCLSVHQPFAAAAWDLLSQQSHLVLDHVIIVLLHADERAEGDIPLLIQHVRDLAYKRLGQVLPAVALGLPSSGEASGLLEMRAMVSQRIEGAVSRRRGIRAVFAAFEAELARIEGRLYERRHEHDGEMHEINRMQTQMEHAAWLRWQDQALDMGRMMGCLLSLPMQWEAQLRQQLSWQAAVKSAFGGENLAQPLGNDCLALTNQALITALKQDQAEWSTAAYELFQRLHEQFPEQVRNLVVMKSAQRLELMKQSELGARLWLMEAQSGLHRLGMRRKLDDMLQQRIQGIRPWLVLVMVAANGLMLSLFLVQAYWLHVLLGVVVLSLSAVFLQRAQQSKIRLIEDYKMVMRSQLQFELSSWRESYSRWLIRHYGDAAFLWDPLRSILRKRFSSLRPSLQRCEELQLNLRLLLHEWE